jgi:hypothetical protein
MSETRTPAEEPAHDVLAAEAFAMPGADPMLHHGPVRLPGDPAGIEEPHDVLAAEEFAMPAPRSGDAGILTRRAESSRRAALVLGVLLLVALLRRRARRGR